MNKIKKILGVLVVVGSLMLLATTVLAVAAKFTDSHPDSETHIYYGTIEDPLGWGTWVTPNDPPYDYVMVEGDLTSIATGKREVLCSPCVPCPLMRSQLVVLHWEDPPPERPPAFYVTVYDNYYPTVGWGHLPDGYYTGWLKLTWIRD